MDKRKIFERMLSNTYTVEDLKKRLGILKVLLEKHFFSNEDLNESEKFLNSTKNIKEDDEEHLEKIKEWGRSFFDSFTYENMYSILDYLLKEVDSTKKLILYSPVELNIEQKEEIGKWVRKEISENILLEITIDEKITCGCGFVWKGNYYELDFDYFLSKNKEKVLSEIKEYAK